MPETFADYLSRQLGTDKWVLAPRLTKRLRESGYTVALGQAAYNTHEVEWERQHYGAPLTSLHAASPELLAALAAVLRDGYPHRVDPSNWVIGPGTVALVRAAIAKAKGEATPVSRPAAG